MNIDKVIDDLITGKIFVNFLNGLRANKLYIGITNLVTGNYSFSLGDNSVVNGDYSAAIGDNVHVAYKYIVNSYTQSTKKIFITGDVSSHFTFGDTLRGFEATVLNNFFDAVVQSSIFNTPNTEIIITIDAFGGNVSTPFWLINTDNQYGTPNNAVIVGKNAITNSTTIFGVGNGVKSTPKLAFEINTSGTTLLNGTGGVNILECYNSSGVLKGYVNQSGDYIPASGAYENTNNKDVTGGYVGLTLFKINFKNILNTFTSYFTNSNTASRIYTFKDSDGTIAFTSDITGTNSGTNTGDVTLATNSGLVFTSGQTGLYVGTPSSITTISTNSVTTNTHTHAISGFATGTGSATNANTGDETATSIATINHAVNAKTTLVDADEITGQDSALSFALMRVTCLNIYNYLLAKFNLVYTVLAGVITAKIYPPSDSVTALQFYKADGTTVVETIDTTNQYHYIKQVGTDATSTATQKSSGFLILEGSGWTGSAESKYTAYIRNVVSTSSNAVYNLVIYVGSSSFIFSQYGQLSLSNTIISTNNITTFASLFLMRNASNTINNGCSTDFSNYNSKICLRYGGMFTNHGAISGTADYILYGCPTQNSLGSIEIFRINSNSVFTFFQNIFSINGQSAQSITVQRNTTTSTAGNNLTIQAGGATTNGAISVLNSVPTNGGSGYAIGDTFNITTGGTGATGIVTAVSSTVVTAVVLMLNGSGYTTGTGKSTSKITGSGNDALTVNITTVLAATDLDGGRLQLNGGISTGTGKTSVRLLRNSRAATTGTTDNTTSDALIVPSEFNLTNSGANSLFTISLTTLNGTGGVIDFSIQTNDATNGQTYTGTVRYSARNKGGVYTSNITEDAETSKSLDTGTLTTAWSITTGTNVITIVLTPTSSLTPTSMKLFYTIKNNSVSTITQL